MTTDPACLTCGAPLAPGSVARFCSSACKQRAYRERHADAARSRDTARKAAARALARSAPGIEPKPPEPEIPGAFQSYLDSRPISREWVEMLKRYMRAFGDEYGQPRFDPRFPVAVDQHGRILDGRHRMLAAAELGLVAKTKVVRVASDADAIAYATIANTGSGFTAADLAEIGGRLLVRPRPE